MHDIAADGAPLQLVFQNDGDTPMEFVAGLLRNVFGKPERDAIAFTQLIRQGKVACGPYPPGVAIDLAFGKPGQNGVELTFLLKTHMQHFLLVAQVELPGERRSRSGDRLNWPGGGNHEDADAALDAALVS